jgi:group I intron endonuclease
MIGIYKITNPKDRTYVGQSIDILSRFSSYRRLCNCKNQVQLYRSLTKYGVEQHTFEILEECEIELLNMRERYWQDYYNVLTEGLNCRLTTTTDKSGKNSQESNLRRSMTQKGTKKGPRPDVSERNRIVHKGKVITEEHRIRNREKQLGVTKVYGGQNEARKRRVVQWSRDGLTKINTWDSIASAAKNVNRGPGDIYRVVSGVGKTCAGYYWTYAEN